MAVHPGITWLLNPPYNEGDSGESSTIMDRAIEWAGEQTLLATEENRDLSFILILPYKRGSPAYKAIQKLGPMARPIMTFAANSCFSFESGFSWRSSDSGWVGGRPSKATFRVGVIELASRIGKQRLAGVYNSLNGAKLYQFAAANSPRGGVAGISLPMAVWSPLSRSLWALRRKDADWVASCHGLPISIDFRTRSLTS
jgi:hypothetical protein